MHYSLNLQLPKGWDSDSETFVEEGVELFHLQAEGPESGTIEVVLGAMPEGSDPKSAAIESYLEVLGTEEDDEDAAAEDVKPIKFQGKEAWGYDCETEVTEEPVRILFAEMLPGVLCMLSVSDKDEAGVQRIIDMVASKAKVSIAY